LFLTLKMGPGAFARRDHTLANGNLLRTETPATAVPRARRTDTMIYNEPQNICRNIVLVSSITLTQRQSPAPSCCA
jgi:hypothetical protein